MKKLRNKIEKLKDACEGRILDREEIFDNRSEKWQESEKGEAYSDKTDKIRDWFDQLGDMLDEIDET
jgi:hypothetical protein